MGKWRGGFVGVYDESDPSVVRVTSFTCSYSRQFFLLGGLTCIISECLRLDLGINMARVSPDFILSQLQPFLLPLGSSHLPPPSLVHLPSSSARDHIPHTVPCGRSIFLGQSACNINCQAPLMVHGCGGGGETGRGRSRRENARELAQYNQLLDL